MFKVRVAFCKLSKMDKIWLIIVSEEQDLRTPHLKSEDLIKEEDSQRVLTTGTQKLNQTC